MDEENQINNKLKIKREMTTVCVKKYCKKNCTESQQLYSLMQNDPTKEMQNKQVKENNSKLERATMAKERSRRFREKKRPNVLKYVHHVVHSFHVCLVVLSIHSFFFLFPSDCLCSAAVYRHESDRCHSFHPYLANILFLVFVSMCCFNIVPKVFIIPDIPQRSSLNLKMF